MPRSTRARASGSKSEVGHCKKMLVASLASGLSTYTGKPSCPFTRPFSLISRMKYSISWVRPTANDGITTVPPRPSVRCSTCVRAPMESGRSPCVRVP